MTKKWNGELLLRVKLNLLLRGSFQAVLKFFFGFVI